MRRDLRLIVIVLIREDFEGKAFADEITKAARSPQLLSYLKTLSVGPFRIWTQNLLLSLTKRAHFTAVLKAWFSNWTGTNAKLRPEGEHKSLDSALIWL